MLPTEKKQILDQIIVSFTKEEIAWSSGYLSGFVTDHKTENKSAKLVKDLTILYVTETGNSKFLAGEIAKKLKAEGAHAKLKAADQYRLADFEKEKNLIVIVSTHGDGEIPAAGKKFFEHITQNELALASLNYLTIALGDTNYPLFCQSGKDIDARLEKLGGKKLAERIDLDLDFENSIPEIFEKIVNIFGHQNWTPQQVRGDGVEGVRGDGVEGVRGDGVEGVRGDGARVCHPALVAGSISSQKKNFSGKILANINLNDIGSSKETRHIEIASDDEIHYEPGDSVGILFGNDELRIEGKITPRLYSIASSTNEHGNEVHLTVSLLRYIDKTGKEVEGLFSGRLARLKIGEKINFYISRNRQFKLPADDKDIIMVGPGTGIAPFRSFLAERNYRGSSGKNWLFFGERNFQTDFLYQVEWQAHLESGLLSKIDLAFSRDQNHKIYVQDRIKENAQEIYRWLENGAYFYVCGDKENMARDVENTLLDVIASEGKIGADEARNYLDHLVKEDRYLRDVY
jgi:sulfite reductase alpha subunit-like flavoprotein